MNIEDATEAALDARLRRVLGGLDAGAGFEVRVMERIAGLAAAEPLDDLRAQFERRRALLRRRLRREASMNGITILGFGACAGALSWRYASEVQQLVMNCAQSVDPNLLVGATAAAVVAALWLVIRRARG